VDLSGVFNADTVASSAANGQSYPPLVSMDGSGYDYMTEAVADSYFDDGAGLPNDGFYPSDTHHPDLQFAFSDSSSTPNSFILNAPSPKILTVTFPVVATSYSTVQIYGTSTEGSSSITVTLGYADSTTDVKTFTIPDWGQSFAASGSVFVVQSFASRFSKSGGDDYGDQFALYGTISPASSTKTLTSVTVTSAGGNGRFVLYGATAY
jgi:hypothetical protein